ncbi:MAG: DNA-directed RNA polymerase subunit omega [Thermoanaerobaculia bacterium]|nr:DNA-directed RNA polymerase subunit omega [Thermoanaerobaculia bacterium]
MTTLPEKIDSRFRFVLLAAQRAERLIQGGRYQPERAEKKPVLTAMREIRTGDVEWDYGPPPEDAPEAETQADA